MQLKYFVSIVAVSFALASCSGQPAPQSSQPSASADPAASATPDQSSGMSQYEAMEKAALSGDYQAQRNLAYILTTGIPHNPILGCAWRIVIVQSGSPQVDQSDTGNKKFACGKLTTDGLAAAEAQAKKLQAKISSK
jgi:hypothetical protein